MNNEINIIEAYEAVIADISQDIGYEAGVLEQTVAILKNRLYELENIWLIKRDSKGGN
jgi:hypothetical protein